MNRSPAPGLELPQPRFLPPLDEGFRPAVLANHAFLRSLGAAGIPLVIGLVRGEDQISRFETRILPEDHPRAAANAVYVERLVKFLLWQKGAHTIYIGGSAGLGEHIRRVYGPRGERKFDHHFMGEQVYGQALRVIPCAEGQVPAEREAGRALGRHLDGNRIGFDLGASDRKASAVIDGQVVYSEEVVWEPRQHSDPDYHYREITSALNAAAARLPRVDAIGGSSAGIYVGNRPKVASLFRSVPPERFAEIQDLFLRIRKEMGVPLEVINDGDVTALAGSMAINDNGILGIAMGSSEAAGYVGMQGQIMGWLNELAFAPIDYSPQAPVEEWSGDLGCGASYLSQQCVFRLASLAGLQLPDDQPDAQKLRFAQEKLEAGHAGALKIWQSIGIYLGYGLAHYADFYQLKHVLILGRCTSGRGGEVILDGARRVLQAEFPELAARIQIHLPDENIRRIGQSVAAASLPALSSLQ
jgi:predicted NBD/HSP70 family sugar kinase